MTITHITQVTEFPLCWPETKPRADRRQNSPFKATHAKALAEIENEMRRSRATELVISMAPPYRKGPVDPGVAVWFNLPPKQKGGAPELHVLACDRYPTQAANLHAIALTLEALRGCDRWGAYTVEQAVEGARALPPPKPDAPPRPDWWVVLDVEREWPRDAIEALARTRAAKHHPDTGGSDEEFQRFQDALADMRREKGGP